MHKLAGLRRCILPDARRRSTRRAFLTAAAAWLALACTGAAFCQAKKRPIRIGWLNNASPTASGRNLEVFKEGMSALGWKEGSDYVMEERWAEGRVDRLSTLAAELAMKKPALIVAAPDNATAAAARASPDIPVVQSNGGSPVAAGLAKSLARPGGMVTGVTNINTEVSEKFLELLLAAVPRMKRVGFLIDAGSANRAAYVETAHRAAQRYSVEARIAEAATAKELAPAIARLAKGGAQGLVLMPNVWSGEERRRILKLALTQRWPVIWGMGFDEEGALLSYGPDRLALHRRAAYYVDRILKGAKPGDLPIEQPTKFELVVNLKTAKALGMALPQAFLLQADRVIE